MHPKIKELAEKAKDSVPAGLLVNEWIDEYNRIFAELIVRECSYVCESMQLLGPYKDVQDATLKDASVQIKEHFGIDNVDAQLRNRSTYFGNNP